MPELAFFTRRRVDVQPAKHPADLIRRAPAPAHALSSWMIAPRSSPARGTTIGPKRRKAPPIGHCGLGGIVLCRPTAMVSAGEAGRTAAASKKLARR